MIDTVEQLESTLSSPSPEDIDALGKMKGTLLILGAGGKMGPSLAVRAKRAIDAGGSGARVIAVSRFTSASIPDELRRAGVEVIASDLLEPAEIAKLPDAESVVFMAGRKFGSTGGEPLTWAMNAYLPALVAERYKNSRIIAFSSGNVYPLVPVWSGGATEATPPAPTGEYAQSVLARERVFEYFSQKNGTPVLLLRLNYAVELRYGVLADIGARVMQRETVDVRMAALNAIWQGDANSVCLRAFDLCDSPASILNLTGPETLSIRWIAAEFARRFRREPAFDGAENDTALLNNASRCHRLFGYPKVTAGEIVEWTARWIAHGGATLGKPTHFEVRDGKY